MAISPFVKSCGVAQKLNLRVEPVAEVALSSFGYLSMVKHKRVEPNI